MRAATTAVPGTPPVNRPGTAQKILQRSTVPVLCYHQIREQTATDSADARPLICPPTVLEGQLRAITEAGMRPVTSTQLVDHLELGTPLPDKPVMISFDDASGGQYTHALPIPERLAMPATFFVMTVSWTGRTGSPATTSAHWTPPE